MKKLVLALAFFAFAQTNAQVTFEPGVKAGYSASTITNIGADYRSDFYVGAYGLLKLTKVYNMQFEVMYLRQGATNYKWMEVQNGNYNVQTVRTDDVKLNYISLNFINKFNVDKFNFHVGPGLDIKVSQNPNEYLNYYNNDYYYNSFAYDSNVGIDLTLNLGLGYQITPNLGFEARMRLGLVEPVDFNGNYYFGDSNLNRSYLIGLNYTFNK